MQSTQKDDDEWLNDQEGWINDNKMDASSASSDSSDDFFDIPFSPNHSWLESPGTAINPISTSDCVSYSLDSHSFESPLRRSSFWDSDDENVLVD
jgi:hypothetical protein